MYIDLNTLAQKVKFQNLDTNKKILSKYQTLERIFFISYLTQVVEYISCSLKKILIKLLFDHKSI